MTRTPARFVGITGPAAAGKSTIAKALQAELGRGGELWLATELDVFARALSRDWISWGQHQGRFAERGFVYTRAGDGSIELTLGPDGRRVLSAFHRSVAAVVTSGIPVICETIVYDDDDWEDWCLALQGGATCWVKLSAPLEILEDRERADRSRIFRGLARGMTARSPAGKYDLEADTAAETVSEIVQRVARALTDASSSA